MTRPLRQAFVDIDAVRHNLAMLKSIVAPAQVMVVVKADGYGHGAFDIARLVVAAGAEWIGVADLSEALELRTHLEAPILAWIHGEEDDYATAVSSNIDIGVSTLAQLERVAAAPGIALVQIKVDTGLSRNGVEERESAALFARAAELEGEGKIVVRGLWSHLANAGKDADREQLRRFAGFLAKAIDAGLTPEFHHIAATAGALTLPEARLDMVRIGIGIYGLSPFEGVSSAALELKPAMELSAEIISVKRVPAGSGVSYGFDYRTAAETTLALVPLGYADGIPRNASGRAPVSINGETYRIAGRVAMDQFVVDVGDDPVALGDRAILFGDPKNGVPSVDDWAKACDTINYEIVTRIGPRVTRSTGVWPPDP